jgi:hypothetical protein
MHQIESYRKESEHHHNLTDLVHIFRPFQFHGTKD